MHVLQILSASVHNREGVMGILHVQYIALLFQLFPCQRVSVVKHINNELRM